MMACIPHADTLEVKGEKAFTSKVTAWGMQAIILSCQTEDRRAKAFTLKKGGLNYKPPVN